MGPPQLAAVQAFVATIDHDIQCLARASDRDRAAEFAKRPILQRLRNCVADVVQLAKEAEYREQALSAFGLIIRQYKTPLVGAIATSSVDSVRQDAAETLMRWYDTRLSPLADDVQCGDLILLTARERIAVSDQTGVPRETAEEVRQLWVELSRKAAALHTPKEGPRADICADIVKLAAADPAAAIAESALALADQTVGFPNASSVVTPIAKVAKSLLAHRLSRLRVKSLKVLAKAIIAGGDEVLEPQPDEEASSRRTTVALITAASVDVTVGVREAAVTFAGEVLRKASTRHEQMRRLVPVLLMGRQDAAPSVRLLAMVQLREVAGGWRDENVRIDGEVSNRPINIRDIEQYGDASDPNADGGYSPEMAACLDGVLSRSTLFVAPSAATRPTSMGDAGVQVSSSAAAAAVLPSGVTDAAPKLAAAVPAKQSPAPTATRSGGGAAGGGGGSGRDSLAALLSSPAPAPARPVQRDSLADLLSQPPKRATAASSTAAHSPAPAAAAAAAASETTSSTLRKPAPADDLFAPKPSASASGTTAAAVTFPEDPRGGRLSLAERSVVANCASGFIPTAIDRAMGVSGSLGPKCMVDVCEYNVRLLAAAVHALEGGAVQYCRQLVGVVSQCLAVGESVEKSAAQMLAHYIGALIPSSQWVQLLLRSPTDSAGGAVDAAAGGAAEGEGVEDEGEVGSSRPAITYVGERRRGGAGGGVDGTGAAGAASQALSVFAVTNSPRQRAALVGCLAELVAGGWRVVNTNDLVSISGALRCGAMTAVDCPEQLAAVCRLCVTVAAVAAKLKEVGVFADKERDDVVYGAFHCTLQLASPAAFGARVVPPSPYDAARLEEDPSRRPLMAPQDLAARLTDTQKISALAYRAAQVISSVVYGSPSSAFKLFFLRVVRTVLECSKGGGFGPTSTGGGRGSGVAVSAGGPSGVGGETLPLIAVTQTLLGADRGPSSGTAAVEQKKGSSGGVFTEAPSAAADTAAVQALCALPITAAVASVAVDAAAVELVVRDVSSAHAPLLCELFVAAFGGMASAPGRAISDAVIHGHVALNHWLSTLPQSVTLPPEGLAKVLRVCVLPFTPWRPRAMDTRRAALATLFSCVLRGHLARTIEVAATVVKRGTDGCDFRTLPQDEGVVRGDGQLAVGENADSGGASAGGALVDPSQPPAASLPGPPSANDVTPAEQPDTALLSGVGIPISALCEAVTSAFDCDEAVLRLSCVRVAAALLQLPIPSSDAAAALLAQLLARLDDSENAIRAAAATAFGEVYGKAVRCGACNAKASLSKANGCVKPASGGSASDDVVIAAPPKAPTSDDLASAAVRASDVGAGGGGGGCCCTCGVSAAAVAVLSGKSAMEPCILRLLLHSDAAIGEAVLTALKAIAEALPDDVDAAVQDAERGGHRHVEVLEVLRKR